MPSPTSDELIPSSTEPEPPGLPATAILPGSEIQKTTAIQQGTLPPPPKIGRFGIAMALGALGGLMTGAAVGAKGGDVLKQAAASQALVDQLSSREALGYLAGLNATVLNTPTLANEALQQLGKFLQENSTMLPPQIQAVGQGLLKNFQGTAVQQGMRETFQAFANRPSTDPRQRDAIETAQMMIQGGSDIGTAFATGVKFAALRPESTTNVTYSSGPGGVGLFVRPNTIDFTKPLDQQIRFYNFNEDGSGSFTFPTTAQELYTASKGRYDEAAQALGFTGLTAAKSAMDLTMQRPGATERNAKIMEKSHALEESAKERGQRQKLSADQIAQIQTPEFKSTYPMVKAKPEYLEDLDVAPNAIRWVQDRIEQHKEEQEYRTKSIAAIAGNVAKPDAAIYDPKTRQQVTGDAVVLAKGVKEGTLVDIGKDNAAKLVTVKQLAREMDMAEYLLEQVRLGTGASPSANVGKMIDLWAQRKGGTSVGVQSKLLRGIFNTSTIQLAKLYTNQGRFAYALAEDLKEQFPFSDNISFQDAKEMLRWAKNVGNATELLLLKQNPPPLDPTEFWRFMGSARKSAAPAAGAGSLGKIPLTWDNPGGR